MKAIGYARVSTDKQAERGVSLEAQCEKIRAMALLRDAELVRTIIDGGESAKTLKRAGMLELLAAVDAGDVETVIVAKLDRLTRQRNRSIRARPPGVWCSSSRSLPHALVARAQVVLWSADGLSNSDIAERLDWTKATVGKWRARFVGRRPAGLYDELRSGRPRSIEDERIAELLQRTLAGKPDGSTHWTIREAAEASGLSKSTVHRVFEAFAIQPHRTRSF